MNLKNRKSFLLAAAIVIVLGLMAFLLTNLPCGQKTAACLYWIAPQSAS